jgi:large subunit ribosomal protein L20
MRVKTGVVARRKHKKILNATKGYRQARSKIYKRAKEAFLHAGQYALNGRRKRTGQMRALWIIRLNAALRGKGISYSQFINKLNKSEVGLNRKMLSELAIQAPAVFDTVVEKVVA